MTGKPDYLTALTPKKEEAADLGLRNLADGAVEAVIEIPGVGISELENARIVQSDIGEVDPIGGDIGRALDAIGEARLGGESELEEVTLDKNAGKSGGNGAIDGG